MTNNTAPRIKTGRWLTFAGVTTVSWGVWGAFIEIPEKAGFPATLGYTVWALTMVPCALVAMGLSGWRLDRSGRPMLMALAAGTLGAAGQLLLFKALRAGPAFLIFPIVSLYPMVTVVLSVALLKERAGHRAWAGILLALVAIPLLSYQPAGTGIVTGHLWLALAVLVFCMWGIQGWLMKWSNDVMSAESIFFYMAVTAVALIPVALWMTDFHASINWGPKGPLLAALVQALNSVGALCLVYALRHGKAIIVVPMTALAPVLTIILSLMLYHLVPSWEIITGMACAVVAIYLLAV
jgi:drug/metabolite transporter (DMT)-like permease